MMDPILGGLRTALAGLTRVPRIQCSPSRMPIHGEAFRCGLLGRLRNGPVKPGRRHRRPRHGTFVGSAPCSPGRFRDAGISSTSPPQSGHPATGLTTPSRFHTNLNATCTVSPRATPAEPHRPPTTPWRPPLDRLKSRCTPTDSRRNRRQSGDPGDSPVPRTGSTNLAGPPHCPQATPPLPGRGSSSGTTRQPPTRARCDPRRRRRPARRARRVGPGHVRPSVDADGFDTRSAQLFNPGPARLVAELVSVHATAAVHRHAQCPARRRGDRQPGACRAIGGWAVPSPWRPRDLGRDRPRQSMPAVLTAPEIGRLTGGRR